MVSKETFAMTGLPAMGCANSAHLYEIQMEKTIAFAIRSVDLDPTSPNPSLVRRGMKIENVGEACLPRYESGKGFPSHSVVPFAFADLWGKVSIVRGRN